MIGVSVLGCLAITSCLLQVENMDISLVSNTRTKTTKYVITELVYEDGECINIELPESIFQDLNDGENKQLMDEIRERYLQYTRPATLVPANKPKISTGVRPTVGSKSPTEECLTKSMNTLKIPVKPPGVKPTSNVGVWSYSHNNLVQVRTQSPSAASVAKLSCIRTTAKPPALRPPIAEGVASGSGLAIRKFGTAWAEAEDLSDFSDIELENPTENTKTLKVWDRPAVLLLISLYKEHQNELESNKQKKIKVWQLVTQEMNDEGYNFNVHHVQCKFNNLVKSHKDFIVKKTKTGKKRCTFQYYEEMEEILQKRHDIVPPYIAGNSVSKELRANSLSGKGKHFSDKPNVPSEESDTNTLSQSDSAIQRRRKRQKRSEDADVGLQTLNFLKSMEESRKMERERQEERMTERANEKNQILRQFLDVFTRK